MRLNFSVEFLSEVVLHGSSNTEGKIEVLDYISGAVFLGIVARKYDDFVNPFSIFHSGSVRFGDAHILINNKPSYKIPLCFFREKNAKDNKIYNSLDGLDKCDQPKQIKTGFMNEDGDYIDFNRFYRQKINLNASDDLYGYNALPKGLKWRFCVKIDESISQSDVEKIKNELSGIKFIGKSKGAEFGKVEITYLGPESSQESSQIKNEKNILYINSNLALFSKAQSTFKISNSTLGTKDLKIDLAKSQLASQIINPFNFIRQNYDFSRTIINKGSVIVVGEISPENREILESGVGGFLSYGYGEILINPKFLQKENLQKYEMKNESNQKSDDKLIKILENRNKKIENIAEKVDDFIKNNKSTFKSVKSSQWGAIYSIALMQTENIREKIKDQTQGSRVESHWDDGRDILLKFLDENGAKALCFLAKKMRAEQEGE